jgi:hypothetical protein
MSGNWIDSATAHAHGQFARKAAKAGMTTRAYAEKHKDAPGKLGEQARLALTLMGMHKDKKSDANTMYGKD